MTEGREASASPENERVRSVKNDVLDKLLRQKELPEGLGLQRAEMAFMTSRPPEGGTANREGNAEVGTEADRELLVS